MGEGILTTRLTHEQNNLKVTALVKQYLIFLSCNFKPGDAFRGIQRMGYEHSMRRLREHVTLFKESGRAIRPASLERGRPRLFDAAQEAAVKAVVAACNKANKKTNHRKLIQYAKDEWDIDVSMSTIKRVEKRIDVCKRKLTKRSRNIKLTADELIKMYWEWIVSQRIENTFSRPKSEIFSFDVTTTKPPEAESTLAEKGSGKQRSGTKVTVNTDAIVTMVCAAGGNPCPCVVFTSNVRLSVVQKNTARGNAIRDHLIDRMTHYGIDPSRIVYEAGKAYTAESSECYTLVIDKYLASGGIPPQALICHDGGNAFKPAGVSIFDDYTVDGVENVKLDHAVYPSPVHQYLSPNDNKIHGIKSKWYLEYEELDDVCRVLRLMQLLDQEMVANAARYFSENILNVKPSHIPLIVRN